MDKSILSSLNGNKSPFTVSDSKKYRFVKKQELKFNTPFFVRSVYVSKGKFGFQSVFMFDNGKDEFYRFSVSDNGSKADSILKSDDIIKAINDSLLTVAFYTYHSKKFDKDVVGTEFDLLEKPTF